MKILVICDGITPFVTGGMQKHTANLVKYMVRRGHQIELLHCVKVGVDLPKHAEVAESLGLEEGAFVSRSFYFPSMGVLPGHYLKESYAYSGKLLDHVKDRLNDFDLIYAKGFSAWKFIEQKKKGVKMPPIGVKFHGYEMFQRLDGWKQKFRAWMLRGAVQWNNVNADFVFSYGGKITDIIQRIGVERTRIIEVPSGIDESWVLPDVPSRVGPIHFLFIGRYEKRKGIEEINQVVANWSDSSEVDFQFIGNIPQSMRIKKDNVVYHGEIKDGRLIKEIMDSCDVLLVPSHSEGMPNVILEGMSRGMAILATDVGAVSALVSEKNGVLIEPLQIEALNASMRRLSECKRADLAVLGRQSLALVKSSYGWASIAEKLENELHLRHLNRS
ncbi:MAG: glycosyltransferase family 4 protein [Flavobacteriales bacterium]